MQAVEIHIEAVMMMNDCALSKMFTRLGHYKYENERYLDLKVRQGRVAFLRAMQYKDVIEYECVSTDYRGSVNYFCIQYLRQEEDPNFEEDDAPLIEVPAPILKP